MKRKVSCAEYDEELRRIGGQGSLTPVASHTCMEGCAFHSGRNIFTRWELDGRAWSETLRRGEGDEEECLHWRLLP